ncbi:hypothetical protein [Kribbella sp. NPDC049227]|uniref:hypothetical protein n=1 Tax=Kribbella sp. NPDC049227 TaxID=3364113 RepID=UPI0037206EAF
MALRELDDGALGILVKRDVGEGRCVADGRVRFSRCENVEAADIEDLASVRCGEGRFGRA